MNGLKELDSWAKTFPNFPSRLAVQNKIAELLAAEQAVEPQATTPSADRWVIITKRHKSIYKGTVLFWGRDNQGYTSDLRLAGRYTGAEARRCKEQSHGEDFGIREADALQIPSMLCIDVGEVENYFRKKEAQCPS